MYYGWVMVAVAAAAMVGTMPGRTNFLGVVSPGLVADPALGLTDQQFGQLNLAAVLLGSVLCVPVGYLVDRLGVRVMLTAVAGGLGAAAVGMAAAADRATFFAGLVLVRGLGQGALSVVALAVVGKWFGRRLGLAMGVFTVLLTFGFVGGAIWLETAYQADGWRAAWARLGYGLVGLAVVGAVVARDGPAGVGDGPSGDDVPVTADESVWEAIGSGRFWAFTAAGCLFALTWSAVTLFPKQLLLARGFPEAGLSDLFQLFMGVMTLAGLPANLVGGWLARRVELGKLLAVGMAALGAALLAFPFVRTTGQAVGLAAALGVSGGLVTVVYFAAYGKAFGRTNLGAVQAVAQVLTVFASAAGPVLLAGCRDRCGGYEPFFWAAGPSAAATAAIAWRTRTVASGTPVASPLPDGTGGPHRVADLS